MRNTTDIIKKATELLHKVESGKMTAPEVRTYIGILRTILDAKKVEIAAAHLSMSIGTVPPVELTEPISPRRLGRAS
jgi:hypothetical protein